MVVPTVERGLRTPVFLPDRDGGTDAFDLVDVGLSIRSRNCRAYAEMIRRNGLTFRVDRVESKRHSPSPLTPVKMTSLPCGRVTSTFFRLCVARAANDERTAGWAFGVEHPTVEKFRVTVERMVLPLFDDRSSVVFRSPDAERGWRTQGMVVQRTGV